MFQSSYNSNHWLSAATVGCSSNCWLTAATVGWQQQLPGSCINCWLPAATVGWKQILLTASTNCWLQAATVGCKQQLLAASSNCWLLGATVWLQQQYCWLPAATDWEVKDSWQCRTVHISANHLPEHHLTYQIHLFPHRSPFSEDGCQFFNQGVFLKNTFCLTKRKMFMLRSLDLHGRLILKNLWNKNIFTKQSIFRYQYYPYGA